MGERDQSNGQRGHRHRWENPASFHNHAAGKKALHVVTAWVVENRLVVAQVATQEKSNEIRFCYGNERQQAVL
jgi:hypothetical protein